MTGYFIVFAAGILLGSWIRGSFAKTAIGDVKNKLRQEEFQTKIDKERLEQHRMLKERIES